MNPKRFNFLHALVAYMYSASVVDKATTICTLDNQLTALLASACEHITCSRFSFINMICIIWIHVSTDHKLQSSKTQCNIEGSFNVSLNPFHNISMFSTKICDKLTDCLTNISLVQIITYIRFSAVDAYNTREKPMLYIMHILSKHNFGIFQI